METELYRICDHFLPGIRVKKVVPYGSGHINDTFKVETGNENYLLQRINHEVFKNVEGLTENIAKVTRHLRDKAMNENSRVKVLTPVKTQFGSFTFSDGSGNYWRMFRFIENSISYDRVERADLAMEGGKAYGWFLLMLDDFPADQLVETIPRFHDIRFRLDNFYNAVKNDNAGRAGEVKKEIDFAEQRADDMKKIYLLGEENRLPVRVTHNDTKINNVLFNDRDKGICIIDLDTVMPGYVHFDFGDAIRTFTNTADEDEQQLSKVSMNIEYFKAFSTGFLSQMKNVLNAEEKETLAFSAKLMTYIIGLRFLTDYLEGDTYYKTNYPEHNLVRAKVQFKLLESMEEHYGEMKRVIKDLT